MKSKENRRILVMGDLILDLYCYGGVKRISPEAPIPVVKIKSSSNILGGAANVANNILELGVKVELCGVTGSDENGTLLRKICTDRGIGCAGIIIGETFQTTTKIRVLGNQQQIVRLDYGEDNIVSETDEEALLKVIIGKIASFDMIVISDYAKGVCTKKICETVIKAAHSGNVPVIVDPKGTDWTKYQGADIITPNLKEFTEALHLGRLENNDAEIESISGNSCRTFGVENILLTRSERGISLIAREGGTVHLPTKAKQVVDVSGAGDTVVAALAVFYQKEKLLEAVKLANLTAGIAVEKKGTATVSRAELFDALNSADNKICSLPRLLSYLTEWKKDNKTIVTTNGCFDVIHAGHISLLEEAAKRGDKLIVAVNSDESVRKLKGLSRPVNKAADRAKVIAAVGCVTAVVIFGGETPEELLKLIMPDVHVKGGDYSGKDVPEARFAKTFVTVDYCMGYSSTNIINELCSSERN